MNVKIWTWPDRDHLNEWKTRLAYAVEYMEGLR